MNDSTKQAKQAQKEFLEALKEISNAGRITVDLCDVYKNGFEAGKIVGKQQSA